MSVASRTLAFLAAACVCAGLSACGSTDEGDPIPPGKAAALESALDRVDRQVDDGLCDDALATIAGIQRTVGTLDEDGVGSDVQDALADGVNNLRVLTPGDCSDEQQTTTPETTPETIPVPTETTPTTPVPTETTPTTTTPTTTTPTTGTTTQPDEGDGEGQLEPGGGGTGVPPGQAKKGAGG